MKLLSLAMGLLLFASMATAQAPRVATTLLADHSSVQSGEPFLVGVLFDIQDQWHIYWKNPGDAGLAPSIKWSLPEGFSVSETLWPVPIRFTQEGNIEGFGYEHSVMLMARVTPPPGFGGPAAIAAEVRWLACQRLCVPGKASVGAQVQVGSSSTLSNREPFAQWLRRLPMDLGSSPMQVNVRRSGLTFELTVSGVPKEATLNVYIAPPENALVRRLDRSNDKTVLEFAPMAGATLKGSAEVVLQKGDTSVRILLPLDP